MSSPTDRARRGAETDVRELVVDAGSPLAQRHVRDGLRKNKLSWILYAAALAAPAAFLLSFYYSKMGEIRANFKDPYALPVGFNPNTGEFTPVGGSASGCPQVVGPQSLILSDEPGGFNARGKRLAKEHGDAKW